MMPILMGTNFIEMFKNYLLGNVRGLGIQHRVGLIVMACYFCISIPLIAYMAFLADESVKDVRGVWLAFYYGVAVQCGIFSYLLVR